MTGVGAVEWRDTLRDVLDIAVGWTRPMTDAERLAAIREIVERALMPPSAAKHEHEAGHRAP